MPKGPISFTFRPSKPLLAGTSYRVTVAGVVDRDGIALAPVSLAVRTINPPAVVRFRPQADARDTARDAAISVRFTEPMDRHSTASAFSVKIGGKAIKGTTSWAESGTVLVFKPATALPYSAAVVAKVDITARSATGAPMTRSVRAIFKTVPSRLPRSRRPHRQAQPPRPAGAARSAAAAGAPSRATTSG